MHGEGILTSHFYYKLCFDRASKAQVQNQTIKDGYSSFGDILSSKNSI